MESPSLIGVLVNWFPMLLLIGVWIYFMRRMGIYGGRYGMTHGEYLKEHLEETRRLNQNLERIAHAIEERADNSC